VLQTLLSSGTFLRGFDLKTSAALHNHSVTPISASLGIYMAMCPFIQTVGETVGT
jgi:hypothetical protein